MTAEIDVDALIDDIKRAQALAQGEYTEALAALATEGKGAFGAAGCDLFDSYEGLHVRRDVIIEDDRSERCSWVVSFGDSFSGSGEISDDNVLFAPADDIADLIAKSWNAADDNLYTRLPNGHLDRIFQRPTSAPLIQRGL